MENEQEGIEIENIGSDGLIDIPDVSEAEGEKETVEETNTETEAEDIKDNIDEEKESLKKGLNAERKQRKEAEKKVKDLEARMTALENANKEQEKSTLEELLESGIDEEVAKSIASAIDKKKVDTSKFEKEIKELKFSNDLMAKSKEEGYEDILDYADEIKSLVDKGLTIEQSYYAASYQQHKTHNTQSEIQRKLEAKMENNAIKKQILGNLTKQAGASVNSNASKVQASPEEIAIAARAGMTVEEYVAIRDMKTTKDYEMYKSKKK